MKKTLTLILILFAIIGYSQTIDLNKPNNYNTLNVDTLDANKLKTDIITTNDSTEITFLEDILCDSSVNITGILDVSKTDTLVSDESYLLGLTENLELKTNPTSQVDRHAFLLDANNNSDIDLPNLNFTGLRLDYDDGDGDRKYIKGLLTSVTKSGNGILTGFFANQLSSALFPSENDTIETSSYRGLYIYDRVATTNSNSRVNLTTDVGDILIKNVFDGTENYIDTWTCIDVEPIETTNQTNMSNWIGLHINNVSLDGTSLSDNDIAIKTDFGGVQFTTDTIRILEENGTDSLNIIVNDSSRFESTTPFNFNNDVTINGGLLEVKDYFGFPFLTNFVAGQNAGASLVATGNNIAIGSDALTTAASGAVSNIAIGRYALQDLQTNSFNIAIGIQSLSDLIDGKYNVAIGQRTGYLNTAGYSNTYLGRYSGYNHLGDSCVFLGSFSGYNSTNEDNVLYIGNPLKYDLIYGEFDNSLVKINGNLEVVSNGTVGIFKAGKFTAVQASALTPANGDFIYVTDTDATFTSVGFWGYENGSWVKL